MQYMPFLKMKVKEGHSAELKAGHVAAITAASVTKVSAAAVAEGSGTPPDFCAAIVAEAAAFEFTYDAQQRQLELERLKQAAPQPLQERLPMENKSSPYVPSWQHKHPACPPPRPVVGFPAAHVFLAKNARLQAFIDHLTLSIWGGESVLPCPSLNAKKGKAGRYRQDGMAGKADSVSRDAIWLGTVHQAKGLEWRGVIVVRH